MSKELRIGATEPAPDSPAFAVSRDSAGILLAVRDNAAPQFAVSRDADGLLLSAWPTRAPAVVGPIEVWGAQDTRVQSISSIWTTARAGANLAAIQAVEGYYPAIGVFYTGSGMCQFVQTFWSFDTSVIPDGAIVTAVDLQMLHATPIGASFLVEVRAHEWGDAITTADWVAGDNLAGKTLLASVMSGDLSSAPVTLTSGSTLVGAIVDAINTTGHIRLMASSKRQRIGPEPWYDEYVRIEHFDYDIRTRLLVTCE